MGCDHESIAIELYAKDMGKQHSGFSCFRSRVCIHEEYQILAATPDGITQCNCCGNGVVEVNALTAIKTLILTQPIAL